MNCRLPKKIGTPGGGTSYPDGAFIPVKKFTAGKTYALVAKIDGVYRYISSTKFNDYTITATEVSVTPGGGYVTFGSEPALFKAEASGDGFTLANGTNYLYGYSDQYSTALRIDTSSSVWTADTSETGGFDSGKYLPKEVTSSVWLKNASGDYEWSIKYESANASFGYDRAGRDSTYSTGFVSFILYEKYEGGSGDGGGGGTTQEYAVTIADTMGHLAEYISDGIVSAEIGSTKATQAGTYTAQSGTILKLYSITDGMTARIVLNGSIVKTSTTDSITYSLTITSNTTATFSVGTYVEWVITTEDGGSSGGGTTPSEYALTYSTSGSNRLCTIQIGSDAATTFPTTATTKAVAANTNVTVSIGTAYSYSRMYISFNGRTVASGSTGGNLEYTFEMTANTTVKVTQSGSGTSSYPYCVITTE